MPSLCATAIRYGENAAKGVGAGIAQAAGAGAVIGGAGGAFTGNQAQEGVVKRCLSGRGYKVLN